MEALHCIDVHVLFSGKDIASFFHFIFYQAYLNLLRLLSETGPVFGVLCVKFTLIMTQEVISFVFMVEEGHLLPPVFLQ